MKSIDITPIIEALIGLVSLIITGFLIPYLRQKLSNEKREKLRSWVSIAVAAAEQLMKEKSGIEKKEYVVSFLLSKGLVFDVDEVTAMIECEVYKLGNRN